MGLKVILECRICHKRREVAAVDPGTYEVFYNHQEIIRCEECARLEEINGNGITKEITREQAKLLIEKIEADSCHVT